MSKKIRIKLGDLKRLIESHLAEDDAPTEPEAFSPAPEKEETGDSLDAQVDRLLNEYEQDSQKAGISTESAVFRDIMNSLISEDTDGNAGEKKSADDIDVENFANSVARLIENFDNLIETKNSLIRRATNLLIERYDDSVKEVFEDTLREQHGLALGQSKTDVENDFDAPPADRAGPALPGDGGGGAPA